MSDTLNVSSVRNYDRAAWYYETSAAVFSLGQIAATKRYSVSQMQPGEKVIFLGVGTGDDAIMAAQRGCDVTCVDISQKMLDRLGEKLRKQNLTAKIVRQNVLEFDGLGEYDVCATHFFLNVFTRDVMRQMLTHAAKLLRPGGKLLIADVAQPQGNFLSRWANVVYLKSAMFSYWMVGLVPLHRNYDYTEFFSEAGLRLEHERYFKLFPLGPIVYQVSVGIKERILSEVSAAGSTSAHLLAGLHYAPTVSGAGAADGNRSNLNSPSS